MVRKHIYFSGRVQGVGFRYSALYLARPLGLTGWVSTNYLNIGGDSGRGGGSAPASTLLGSYYGDEGAGTDRYSTLQIQQSGNGVMYSSTSQPDFRNTPVRLEDLGEIPTFGDLKLGKISEEQGTTPDGDATFKGAVFEVINANALVAVTSPSVSFSNFQLISCSRFTLRFGNSAFSR